MDDLKSLRDWHKLYRLFVISQIRTTESDQPFLLDVADEFMKFTSDIETGKIEVDEDGYTYYEDHDKKLKWNKDISKGQWKTVADEINRWKGR